MNSVRIGFLSAWCEEGQNILLFFFGCVCVRSRRDSLPLGFGETRSSVLLFLPRVS